VSTFGHDSTDAYENEIKQKSSKFTLKISVTKNSRTIKWRQKGEIEHIFVDIQQFIQSMLYGALRKGLSD
jgi:hypothetical protein